MIKQIALHRQHGILFDGEKKCTMSTNNLNESLGHCTKEHIKKCIVVLLDISVGKEACH